MLAMIQLLANIVHARPFEKTVSRTGNRDSFLQIGTFTTSQQQRNSATSRGRPFEIQRLPYSRGVATCWNLERIGTVAALRECNEWCAQERKDGRESKIHC